MAGSDGSRGAARYPGLTAGNMQLAVEMVTKGSYAGTQATLDTWAAALSSFAEICGESGVDDT